MKYKSIAGSKKLSTYIKPMLATLTDRPAFDDPEWIFEIKWDGYRAIAETGNETKFHSRNGLTFHHAYPKVYEALKKIKTQLILDGEVVVFDHADRPSFQKLQNYESNKNLPIAYYVFDCLAYNGKDITQLPLLERKQLLEKILPANDIIRYSDHVVEEGTALFNEIRKRKLEGIIAKRSRSTYEKGKRTTDWLKIKNVNSDEAIIIGFTEPKGSRQYFGSLLLAAYQDGLLRSVGSVGTGFNQTRLQDVHAKLKPLIRKTSPLDIPIKPARDIHWVAPKLVCSIAYSERTDEGIFRHPVFLGLRPDKHPEEIATN
jgi:bifunctional non-homologous end joining protein LigD